LVFEGLDELEEYLGKLRRDFNLHMYKKVKSNLDSSIAENIVSGGKRLRPLLLLLVFKAFNGKDFEKALDVASALELAHNASLTHDDIIDVDFERRGKPTLWRQIGIGRALIEGHRLINLAFQIALSEGLEIAKIFLEAWDRASNGVLKELMHRELPGKTLYLRIIKEKTASLFEAAAECGALIAGASPELIKQAKKFGEKVGIAYQLADDYVDIIKGRFSIRAHLVFYNRFEEKIRQIMLAVKLKTAPPLRSLLAPTIDWKKFLVEEIAKNIGEAKRIVKDLDLVEPEKTYLKRFPEYCVYSMLREAG
jgi:geranylgeranyl pyrophosphate synthase